MEYHEIEYSGILDDNDSLSIITQSYSDFESAYVKLEKLLENISESPYYVTNRQIGTDKIQIEFYDRERDGKQRYFEYLSIVEIVDDLHQ